MAEHLHALGGLADGIDTGYATDVLWFSFGYSGYLMLTEDNGWSLPEAERWLLAQCARVLLRPAQGTCGAGRTLDVSCHTLRYLTPACQKCQRPDRRSPTP
ncbi:hypothetical protein GCM10022419_062630 [Nonomuraea rosea]|uniref:Uncharacterized protein n=1 Tax=Nonomuraea rosea TaxID=638574 RepID=A0ABP6XVE0_9ACTN